MPARLPAPSDQKIVIINPARENANSHPRVAAQADRSVTDNELGTRERQRLGAAQEVSGEFGERSHGTLVGSLDAHCERRDALIGRRRGRPAPAVPMPALDSGRRRSWRR